MLQALDGAMKQYKALSPATAAMFFSVDEDAGKIMCMSCVPKVRNAMELQLISAPLLPLLLNHQSENLIGIKTKFTGTLSAILCCLVKMD